MNTWPRALALILALEGGCADHPDDPGGVTCYGITQAAYGSWRRGRGLEPRPVTKIENTEVEAIYRERYWEPSGAEGWASAGHPGIALYVFDAAVQHGLGGLRRLLTDDLVERLRSYPLLGLAILHTQRMEYYASLPHWDTFGRGWTRRIATVYREAVNWEHPKGRLLVDRLNLNGIEWSVSVARQVGKKLWVRGKRHRERPCSKWRRMIGGCNGA